MTKDDAISRQAALDINERHHGQMPNHVNFQIYEEIQALPSVSPMPKMGRWNFTKHYGRDYYVCSVCGMERMDDHSSGWNYCPNCGAKMQEANG